jgi:hypothetical protein
MKKIIAIFSVIFIMVVTLAGCSGHDDTVQNCIVSNKSYTTQKDLEAATQLDTLKAGEPLFASVYFIESPKGMEYTVKWYIGGTEIKSETKATANATKDIVVYELEAGTAVAGNLKLQVMYMDTVLVTKELAIK